MEFLHKNLDESNEILISEFLKNIEEIENLIKYNYDEILFCLQKCIDESVDRIKILQKKGLKKSIKYISFSILLSSLLTENYSLGINFYDETFYLDEVEVFSEWKIKYISNFVNNSIQMVEKNLNSKNIPFEQGYLLDLKQSQGLIYTLVWSILLKQFIPVVLKNIERSDFMNHEVVEITFGLYMEKQTLIYK